MARLVLSKTEARQKIKTRLDGIDINNQAEWSQLAYHNLKTLLDELIGSRPAKILVYKPLAKYREVDITKLAKDLSLAQFQQVESGKNAKNPAGLFDYILVPLYGFNETGFRLGHGGGWYDKFLATQPKAIKIGVGLSLSLINFQEEPHDIAMDMIVTEKYPN